MVTESPNTPALPFTLTRSLRNFSKEPISMILSSTGLAQSRTKVFVFFFCLFAPFGAILALNDTKPSQSVVEKEREREESFVSGALELHSGGRVMAISACS